MSALCEIAVHAIEVALTEGTRRRPSLAGLDAPLVAPGASFVTLERGGRLLGCVGRLEARVPLAFDVADHAVAAALDDPRVPAVTHADFPEMSVKVSVIAPSEPVTARTFDELRAAVREGVDGLTIEAGLHRATLLPSVWPKVVDRDEFLTALWRKAGLRPGAWPRRIAVTRYTTVEESDPGPRRTL
jgi:hypothetical protein